MTANQHTHELIQNSASSLAYQPHEVDQTKLGDQQNKEANSFLGQKTKAKNLFVKKLSAKKTKSRFARASVERLKDITTHAKNSP
ncbi:hypothetical protein PAHAL_9G289300 [Panicum hallii]|jgi:hypothetical protein|uniref:Uncharacterized protein n=1 Tax=Panicum hallii TaxID=206008 RepID=A0A2T8I2V4_9POAL|nr:hypothetical protein PAHAL_9G289300 [Panicum hallii]